MERKKDTESNKRSNEARKAHARVDITGTLKLKDFNSMKKCVVWLAEIARGMTWEEHMAEASLELREQWVAEGRILGEDWRLDAAPIFSLGGV